MWASCPTETYHIIVSITISAVPGSPPMVEVSTETVVTGMYTDVNGDKRLTAARLNKPSRMDRIALLKGFMLWEA